MIVAIDGPAASGKGTLGRRLAAHYGLRHLDTGLTYRAVAAALLRDGMPLDDAQSAIAAAKSVDFSDLDRARLSEHGVGEAASRIAVIPELRRELVEAQRRFAAEPPGAVVDGRDIGTVVCPGADVKFFVTASPEARARRRHAEIVAGGGQIEYEQVLADIRRRDERDMGRADSPLKPADDAHLIDTTTMDIETAFAAVLALVENEVGR